MGGKWLTFEERKNFIEVESNSGCILLSNETGFINRRSKLKIQCKCGEIFYTGYESFVRQNKRQCRKCKNEELRQKRNFSFDYIRSYIESFEGYKLIDNFYINARTKLNIMCPRGHIFKMSFECFQRGSRCPVCYGKQVKTTDKFKSEIKEKYNDEYEVLGEYVNAHTKILVKHIKCSNEYKVTPDAILRGNGCPLCNQSKGEQKIRLYLENNDFVFDREYDKFENLKSDLGNPLRFDFAMFNDINKENLFCLIEFDGEQHFRWIKGWQTKRDFETLQYHDKLKNEFCKINNINLIRIKYSEFENIEEILNKYIKEVYINNDYK